MRPAPPDDDARYRSQPVRRWVSPYGPIDYAVVLKNNLRQRPTSRYRADTSFLPASFDLADVEPALRVGFLGDLMPCGRSEVQLSPGLVDFFAGVDRVVVNFEGSVWAGPEPAPKVLAAQRHRDLRTLEALDALGVERRHIVVSLANNHSADFGYETFLHTATSIAEAGFTVVGSAWDAAVDLHPQVNLAAVTQWTNQSHDYAAFLADADRWRDPDRCNLLFPHWGHELETHPRPSHVARARTLLQRWDAIIGHHSHGPAPVVAMEHGDQDQVGLVAYSLGDATTSMRWPAYHHGLALRLDLGPDATGRWRVGGGRWTFLEIDPGPPTVVAAQPCSPWFPGLEAQEGH